PVARRPRATSRPRRAAYALETAALLKGGRSTAVRRHAQVTTEISAVARLVRSGATGRMVRVPNDVAFSAILPQRCNQRPVFSTISFFASGMSCGGGVVLSRPGGGFVIRVGWLAGGVGGCPRERL